MPGAAFHSHYWQGDGGGTPPATVPVVGGYPAWQTSVILGGGFGVMQAVWEWIVPPSKELSRGDQ
jgi:hypothetical protein